jgi:hypothetical protein
MKTTLVPCVLLLVLITPLQAGPRASASYSIVTDTADNGGRRTVSASYTNDGSAAGVAGISNVALPSEVVKHGYIGQLYESAALAGIASTKTHGGAGAFAINLPTSGNLGIECRSGGANNDHTLVFTFVNTLTGVSGASVTAGTGSIVSLGIGADAHQYVVNLTGVTNAQMIRVSLDNVTDSAGGNSSAVDAWMGVLLGDTTGNGSVNGSDVSQTRLQSGQALSGSNFRSDVTVNGLINGSDISSVKLKSGTALP